MNSKRCCSFPPSHSADPSFLTDAAQAVSYIRRKPTAARRKTYKRLAERYLLSKSLPPLRRANFHLPTLSESMHFAVNKLQPCTADAFLFLFFFFSTMHQSREGWRVDGVLHLCCVSFGAAYLLIKISISPLFSLCVSLSAAC